MALRPHRTTRGSRLTGTYVVSEQMTMAAPVPVAAARLANLVASGMFRAASDRAFEAGTGLFRIGPAPGISRLAAVRFGELTATPDSAHLACRWEVIGPGAGLFPALDGVYRPPLGVLGAGLDKALLHCVATVTIRAFVGRIGAALDNPAPAAESVAVRAVGQIPAAATA